MEERAVFYLESAISCSYLNKYKTSIPFVCLFVFLDFLFLVSILYFQLDPKNGHHEHWIIFNLLIGALGFPLCQGQLSRSK